MNKCKTSLSLVLSIYEESRVCVNGVILHHYTSVLRHKFLHVTTGVCPSFAHRKICQLTISYTISKFCCVRATRHILLYCQDIRSNSSHNIFIWVAITIKPIDTIGIPSHQKVQDHERIWKQLTVKDDQPMRSPALPQIIIII